MDGKIDHQKINYPEYYLHRYPFIHLGRERSWHWEGRVLPKNTTQWYRNPVHLLLDHGTCHLPSSIIKIWFLLATQVGVPTILAISGIYNILRTRAMRLHPCWDPLQIMLWFIWEVTIALCVRTLKYSVVFGKLHNFNPKWTITWCELGCNKDLNTLDKS